jgi:hypothetical protein
MQRQALESEYVSANLHKWVDLMFGVKTRGKEAVKAQNVFFHLTYSENVPNVDAVADPELREATMLQVINFGQVPQQLFFHHHPERKVTHTTVTANVAARARSFSNALSLKAKDTAEKTKSSVTAKWRQATAKISFFKRKPRASSVEEDMSYVRS